MLIQGRQQIPSASLKFDRPLHFHIYQIVSFLPGVPCPSYCYYKWCGNRIGRRWLIYIKVWVGGQGMVIVLQFLFASLACAFDLSFSLVLWAWQLFCLFFFFVFILSGCFKQELLVHRNCGVYGVKLFQKSITGDYLVDILGKEEMLYIESHVTWSYMEFIISA